MKKLICILLSLLICIGLCSCDIAEINSDVNAQPTETDTETASKTDVETESTTCANTEIETGSSPTKMPVFGRVECKNESGILVDLVGIGEVYIEGSYNFKMFDSVAVTYDPDDLIEESGKIPCLCIIDMPSESIYEYILIDLIEIRKTDPSKGEPLYD